MIDEEGAGPDQGIAGPQVGQIGLGGGAAVVDGLEERGIEPAKPGQGLRIDPIRLAVAPVDQAQLPRVGHQHLMAPALEQATHPGGVGADFQDDPTAGERGEGTLERDRRRAKPLGGDELPPGIEGAEVREAIAEIEADR